MKKSIYIQPKIELYTTAVTCMNWFSTANDNDASTPHINNTQDDADPEEALSKTYLYNIWEEKIPNI